MVKFTEMKKVFSILMCYAVGVVAFSLNAAEDVVAYTTMDFSNPALWGQTPFYGLDDSGQVGSQDFKYWWTFGEDGGNVSVILNYGHSMTDAYGRFGAAGQPNPKPPYMASDVYNQGYLDFRTMDPLARTFEPIKADGTSDGVSVPAEDGFFVDTLVKFYPRVNAVDEVPMADVGGKAKFMCWMSSPEGSGATNLVVTAGYFEADGSLVRTNYVIDAIVEAGVWYRLTARVLQNAATKAGAQQPCFVLYLDGQPLVCSAGDYRIGADSAAMDEMFAGNEFYDGRSLFPPIRPFEGPSPKMSGFAVQGRGWYDELGAVNSGNPMAYESTVLDISVVMDTNAVTNVAYTVTAKGASAPYASGSFTRPTVIQANTNEIVHIEPFVRDEYLLAPALMLSGNTAACDPLGTAGYDIALKDAFSDNSKLTARINVGNANFRVGDEVYESVEDAMKRANKSGLPLQLENNVTLDPNTRFGQMNVRPNYNLVFDLCGRRLKGENFAEEATIYNQGRLTILDTVGGGVIEANGKAIENVISNTALEVNYYMAALTLGDENVRGDFTVTGRVVCTDGELVIKGGTYLTPPDLPADDFYLAAYTADRQLGDARCKTEYVGERHWRVSYDDRISVRFKADVGVPVPAQTNVDLTVGAKLVEPAIDGAVGYTVTNWYVEGSDPRVSWNFATDEVTADNANLTLVAQLRRETYAIVYDVPTITKPSSYSVVSEPTTLEVPVRAHFLFMGWKDAETGHFVDSVGKGATYVDAPETLVSGNLDLRAQWLPVAIRWTNAGEGHSESNGTYAGSWAFRIPASASLPSGSEVVIDEIAFCIVNPLLYPKTAAYLAVTNEATAVISARREYAVDEATGEYLAGANALTNGRARVAYRFDGGVLKMKAGQPMNACFSSDGAAVVPFKGFLRLTYEPNGADAVFGNCREAGGNPLSADYLKYCPTYEVTGHLEDEE